MYAGTPHYGLIRTHHYLDRCQQRGVPTDACDVLYDHGRKLPGRVPGETIYWLDRLTALRAAQRGLNIWAYEHVAVVVFDDQRALTVFRCDEAGAHRRWKGVL